MRNSKRSIISDDDSCIVDQIYPGELTDRHEVRPRASARRFDDLRTSLSGKRTSQRGSATLGAMAIVTVLAMLACAVACMVAHPYLGVSAYLGAVYVSLVIFRDGAFK